MAYPSAPQTSRERGLEVSRPGSVTSTVHGDPNHVPAPSLSHAVPQNEKKPGPGEVTGPTDRSHGVSDKGGSNSRPARARSGPGRTSSRCVTVHQGRSEADLWQGLYSGRATGKCQPWRPSPVRCPLHLASGGPEQIPLQATGKAPGSHHDPLCRCWASISSPRAKVILAFSCAQRLLFSLAFLEQTPGVSFSWWRTTSAG